MPGVLESHIARIPAGQGLDWPSVMGLDALVRECSRLLFELCQKDYRPWLSESDLQSLYYMILHREFPVHGVSYSAIHTNYACYLPDEYRQRLGIRSRRLPVDLALVIPQSIHILRGRHWDADLSVAIEVKRGFERFREVRADLTKLATIRAAWPQVQVYMLIMGYHSQQEDIGSVIKVANDLDVPLLQSNYWGQDAKVDQPELV